MQDMQINIQEKGLTLSETERKYILTKMEKVVTLAKRIQDESSEVRVEIDHDNTRSQSDEITCIITLFVPKKTIRAEAHGAVVNESLDLAKKKLLPQIEAYKDKFCVSH